MKTNIFKWIFGDWYRSLFIFSSMICTVVLIPLFFFFPEFFELKQKSILIEKTVYHQDIILIQEYYYAQMIDSMKSHEGFVDTPYICPGDQLTIGYGHQIRPGDPLRLTEHQADSILRSDLNFGIMRARQLTGKSGNKALALGAFICAVGEGKFKRSTMFKKILLGEPIDQEWERWVYIKGRYSKRTHQFRKWQKYLYNLD